MGVGRRLKCGFHPPFSSQDQSNLGYNPLIVWEKGYNRKKGIKVMFGSGMKFYFNNESWLSAVLVSSGKSFTRLAIMV